MPNVILPYIKAWAALIVAVVGAVLAGVTDAPRWAYLILAGLTAIAVYGAPNSDPGEDAGDGGPVG